MLPSFSKRLEEEEKDVIMYGGSLTLETITFGPANYASLSFPQKLHKKDRRGVQDGGSNGLTVKSWVGMSSERKLFGYMKDCPPV